MVKGPETLLKILSGKFQILITFFLQLFLVLTWRPFNGDYQPIIDGISFGQRGSGFDSFIGRTRFFNGFQIGRIDVNNPNIYFLYDGSEISTNETVEYLSRNQNYSYEWISSSNGSQVEHAVTMNVPRSSNQFVGRVKVGGIAFLGAVVKSLGGLVYADDGGVIKFSSIYEVLICKLREFEFLYFIFPILSIFKIFPSCWTPKT
jgi:hypothetical protein